MNINYPILIITFLLLLVACSTTENKKNIEITCQEKNGLELEYTQLTANKVSEFMNLINEDCSDFDELDNKPMTHMIKSCFEYKREKCTKNKIDYCDYIYKKAETFFNAELNGANYKFNFQIDNKIIWQHVKGPNCGNNQYMSILKNGLVAVTLDGEPKIVQVNLYTCEVPLECTSN
jgi:hypothetical protein